MIIVSPEELVTPVVYEHAINSRAGQSLTVECNFVVPANLFRPPSVQWLNSAGYLKSSTRNLSISHILTSDGGVYTCNVTIIIPELKVSLTGANTTTVTIESK